MLTANWENSVSSHKISAHFMQLVHGHQASASMVIKYRLCQCFRHIGGKEGSCVFSYLQHLWFKPVGKPKPVWCVILVFLLWKRKKTSVVTLFFFFFLPSPNNLWSTYIQLNTSLNYSWATSHFTSKVIEKGRISFPSSALSVLEAYVSITGMNYMH